MPNIFGDLYPLLYMQFELDYGPDKDGRGGYYGFAADSIELAQSVGMENGKKVLEVGAGTSISTQALFDIAEPSYVVGIDEQPEMLKIAKLIFGELEDEESVYEKIRDQDYYPEQLRCGMQDLEKHLKDLHNKYSEYKNRVNFEHKDVAAIAAEGFDYAFANQVIHWLRKRDPQLEYEQSALQRIYSALNNGGLFIFNTSGADYEFAEGELNDIHVFQQPFYQAFRKEIFNLIEKSDPKSGYTYNHAEIENIMNNNGFEVIKFESQKYVYGPERMTAMCLIAGHMEIFKKLGIVVNTNERRLILETALETAKKSFEPSEVIETGIHYVVQKI